MLPSPWLIEQILHQGRAAVEEYKRRRAAGEIVLDPKVQAAVDAFRREREMSLSGSAEDA